MNTEGPTTALPSSFAGNENSADFLANLQQETPQSITPENPVLQAASEQLDQTIRDFKLHGDAFLAAGGDPMELMRRFQAVVMGG